MTTIKKLLNDNVAGPVKGFIDTALNFAKEIITGATSIIPGKNLEYCKNLVTLAIVIAFFNLFVSPKKPF